MPTGSLKPVKTDSDRVKSDSVKPDSLQQLDDTYYTPEEPVQLTGHQHIPATIHNLLPEDPSVEDTTLTSLPVKLSKKFNLRNYARTNGTAEDTVLQSALVKEEDNDQHYPTEKDTEFWMHQRYNVNDADDWVFLEDVVSTEHRLSKRGSRRVYHDRESKHKTYQTKEQPFTLPRTEGLLLLPVPGNDKTDTDAKDEEENRPSATSTNQLKQDSTSEEIPVQDSLRKHSSRTTESEEPLEQKQELSGDDENDVLASNSTASGAKSSAGPEKLPQDIIKENGRVGLLFSSKAMVQLVVNPMVGPLTAHIGYSLPLILGTHNLILSALREYW